MHAGFLRTSQYLNTPSFSRCPFIPHFTSSVFATGCLGTNDKQLASSFDGRRRKMGQPCNDNSQGRAALGAASPKVVGNVPPKAQCIHQGHLLQDCMLDLEACLPRCECLEQRMEPVTSGLAFGGAIIQGSKTAKDFYRNYKDAKKQISQAQLQSQQLHSTVKQLNELPPSKQELIAPVKASLSNIQEALPTTIQSARKRDRVRWVTSGKSNFERETSQTNRVESSATLNILISVSQDM